MITKKIILSRKRINLVIETFEAHFTDNDRRNGKHHYSDDKSFHWHRPSHDVFDAQTAKDEAADGAHQDDAAGRDDPRQQQVRFAVVQRRPMQQQRKEEHHRRNDGHCDSQLVRYLMNDTRPRL